MVSVNPTPGDSNKNDLPKLKAEVKENPSDNLSIWNKYDSDGNGTVEENEVKEFVRDNMPPIAGLKSTIDTFNGSVAALHKHIGTTWKDSIENMSKALKEYIDTANKDKIKNSAADNGLIN